MVYHHLPYIRKLRVHRGPVLGPMHPGAKKYPKIHLILGFSKKKPFLLLLPKKTKISLKWSKMPFLAYFDPLNGHWVTYLGYMECPGWANQSSLPK